MLEEKIIKLKEASKLRAGGSYIITDQNSSGYEMDISAFKNGINFIAVINGKDKIIKKVLKI